MPQLNPRLLRTYYQHSWNRSDLPSDFYDQIDFDQYLSIQRAAFPLMSRSTAAAQSQIERFRSAGATSSEDSISAPVSMSTIVVGRRKMLDLRQCQIGLDIERLVVEKAPEVRGWGLVMELPALREVVVNLCGCGPETDAIVDRYIERLEVRECSRALLVRLLDGVHATTVVVRDASRVLDLARLPLHSGIKDLTIGGACVRSWSCLKAHAFRSLHLGGAVLDEDFPSALNGSRATLTSLRVFADIPFPPESLADLGAFGLLRRVEVSVVGDEFRDAWIDYAVGRPTIDFLFMRPEPGGAASSPRLAEIHKGVPILALRRGARMVYEVSGDAVDWVESTSNEELEAKLQKKAQEQRKRVTWSSEHDSFVAFCPSLDTARWLIDAIVELATGR